MASAGDALREPVNSCTASSLLAQIPVISQRIEAFSGALERIAQDVSDLGDTDKWILVISEDLKDLIIIYHRRASSHMMRVLSSDNKPKLVGIRLLVEPQQLSNLGPIRQYGHTTASWMHSENDPHPLSHQRTRYCGRPRPQCNRQNSTTKGWLYFHSALGRRLSGSGVTSGA